MRTSIINQLDLQHVLLLDEVQRASQMTDELITSQNKCNKNNAINYRLKAP